MDLLQIKILSVPIAIAIFFLITAYLLEKEKWNKKIKLYFKIKEDFLKEISEQIEGNFITDGALDPPWVDLNLDDHNLRIKYDRGGTWNNKFLKVLTHVVSTLTSRICKYKSDCPKTYITLKLNNNNLFEISLRDKNILDEFLVNKMDGQDINIGDEFFDDWFIVKGSNEEFIRILLSDKDIKNTLNKQKDVELYTIHEKNLLLFCCDGWVKDENTIFDFIKMFKNIINLSHENKIII